MFAHFPHSTPCTMKKIALTPEKYFVKSKMKNNSISRKILLSFQKSLIFITLFSLTLAIPDRGIKPKPENSQNHHETMVEPSKHDDENRRQMRLFFTQAFATSTVIQGTSTLSTWKSCWSTPGAINDCSSTSLVSGKRRRRESEQIEDKPYVLVDGKQYDFAELIKASRVRLTQCGNFRFYVKSIYRILEVQNLPFYHV